VSAPAGAPASGHREPASRRGRPRSERSRQAILEAAAELLLAHGLGGVSMDAVAARAGAGKATIYRWWPSKEALALDALYARWEPAAGNAPDTGSLRGDLLALLEPWVEMVGERSYARVMAAILAAAQDDPAFAERYRERFVHPRREPARAAFARARRRGEIAPGLDVELALDLVYGPVYHRLLHGHAPLDGDFARRLVEAALTGIEPGWPRRQRP
jgi:AcrR family transcriptional regulator